jgi:hypothetical protein
MVEGNMKFAEVSNVIVASADKSYAVTVGVTRSEIELAPGDCNPVGPSGYIDTAVPAVIESALGDEDIVYIFLYADTVSFTIAAGRGDIQSFDDYIGRIFFKGKTAYDGRTFTYTPDSLIRPYANFFVCE